MGFFDLKIGVFQPTVVRVYCTFNAGEKLYKSHIFVTIEGTI